MIDDVRSPSSLRVMITAGASGIGKVISSKFYQIGAKIHIVDVDAQAIERIVIGSDEDRIIKSVADVASEKSVKSCHDKQNETFGGIDVLVNCAGVKGPTGYTEDLDAADWQRCMDVNLLGSFLNAKYAIPSLKSQRCGSIINISSTAGWHGYPLRTPYASAKWAVIGFTKSLAMELGPFGVRANAVCPGTVAGERMDKVIKDEAEVKGITEEEVRSRYTNGVSMRTMIDPEDIADTVCFLASDAARKITGQYLSVDGHLENIGGLDI